jgi:uncharacterized metal-binding protein YceD (DUF177 family)
MSLDSWKLALRDVPEGGLVIRREASGTEREALARDLDILSVDSLRLDARLVPRRAGTYRLDGAIDARVVQACVVSLDPVPSNIHADLHIDLRPAGQIEADQDLEATESLLDEPDVEAIDNGEIDLGRIVYEELASGLDPYPRLDGIALDQSEAGSGGTDTGPFARLKELKERQGGDEPG